MLLKKVTDPAHAPSPDMYGNVVENVLSVESRAYDIAAFDHVINLEGKFSPVHRWKVLYVMGNAKLPQSFSKTSLTSGTRAYDVRVKAFRDADRGSAWHLEST